MSSCNKPVRHAVRSFGRQVGVCSGWCVQKVQMKVRVEQVEPMDAAMRRRERQRERGPGGESTSTAGQQHPPSMQMASRTRFGIIYLDKKLCSGLRAARSLRALSTLNTDYQYIERSAERTDKYQAQLPKLPIPDLEETCKRYLDAVRPIIIDGNQLSNTEKHVKDFKHTIGQQLDHELRRKYEDDAVEHYFHEYWDEGYLAYRVPTVINVNPYMILENDPNIDRNPVLRATSLLISLLRYRRSLLDNVLTPEKIDMRSFKNLFSTTRMPRAGEDTVEYFGEEQKHVVFIRNGQFYQFNVLDQQGNIKPAQDIYNFVQNLSEYTELDDQSITPFSALDRDTWTSVRAKLENLTERNRKHLHAIDSALFVVCLDDESYEEKENLKSNLNRRSLGFLHGSYKPEYVNEQPTLSVNRWFDKSIQLIVTKYADAGINWEHSWGDGIIILNLLNKVHSDAIRVNQQYLSGLMQESNKYNISAFKLGFDLDDELKNDLNAAVDHYKKLVGELKLSVVSYPNMDRSFIKSKHISPDFVFQMAFQLANYKLFTKTAPTYEACSTAKFRRGRTENIRAATMETKLASNALAWGEMRFSYSDLREALSAASAKHQELSRLASAGQGFDRHLFAMKCLAKSLDIAPTPAIFEDPTFNFANHFILSTSHLYADNVCSGGYGPVVDDGFGLAYGFTSQGLTLNCTSFEGQDADQFAEAFIDSLTEINNVLTRSTDLKPEV